MAERPDSQGSRPVGGHGLLYWAMIASLVVVLFLIGTFDETILGVLTISWLKLLEAVGLRHLAESMQQGISGGITKRLLPAVATYALLYLGVCLLLLRLLLPAPGQWRMVLRLYAGTLLVYLAITLAGKLLGNAAWAYRLSRQILDFVVSPLPVVGLYVLLQVSLGRSR